MAILMSTHNIGFYEEISKIIPELSSNMHYICSSEVMKACQVIQLEGKVMEAYHEKTCISLAQISCSTHK